MNLTESTVRKLTNRTDFILSNSQCRITQFFHMLLCEFDSVLCYAMSLSKKQFQFPKRRLPNDFGEVFCSDVVAVVVVVIAGFLLVSSSSSSSTHRFITLTWRNSVSLNNGTLAWSRTFHNESQDNPSFDLESKHEPYRSKQSTESVPERVSIESDLGYPPVWRTRLDATDPVCLSVC